MLDKNTHLSPPKASKRLKHFPGFTEEQLSQPLSKDPQVLDLGTLGTDLWPPLAVMEQARQSALWSKWRNQYAPFVGQFPLRTAIAQKINRQTGQRYTANEVVVTCGATESMLNALYAVTEPGDEVILTDPTYFGMIYRVQLVGAIPQLVPYQMVDNTWRLDLKKLAARINTNTKAIFLMNPSMPTGAVLTLAEWQEISRLCQKNGLWLIYNAAMERILFDNRQVIHPATIPGMENYTITIGSLSKEYRMVDWRIGWTIAPKRLIPTLAKAHIYNVVTATGIAQWAAMEALNEPTSAFLHCCERWEKRRDIINQELVNYQMIPAAGGWSQILDVSTLGMDAQTAAQKLRELGKVNTTPMNHWGLKNSSQFLRLVFSNESEERLRSIGERFYLTFGR